jgi:hypothetical protein
VGAVGGPADADPAGAGPAGPGAFRAQLEQPVLDCPDPSRPQQVHLDVRVDDVAQAEAYAPTLGARRAPAPPGNGFLVLLDPVGHPFCLGHGPSPVPDPRMPFDTTE